MTFQIRFRAMFDGLRRAPFVGDIRRGSSYEPVGFIDDDPSKVGRTIHGVKVLGTRQELGRIVTETNPREVLVSMPSAPASIVRALVHQLEPFNLSITLLPSLAELANRKVKLSTYALSNVASIDFEGRRRAA